MIAYKIETKGEWSTDCLIIFEKDEKKAISIFWERAYPNGIKQLQLNGEEIELDIDVWEVDEGSVIKPMGYDYTDASLE